MIHALIVAFFVSGELAAWETKMFVDESWCERAKARALEAAKANDIDVWIKCVPVDHTPKKPAALLQRGGNS